MLPWVPRASLSAWSRKIKIAAREMFWAVQAKELQPMTATTMTPSHPMGGSMTLPSFGTFAEPKDNKFLLF